MSENLSLKNLLKKYFPKNFMQLKMRVWLHKKNVRVQKGLRLFEKLKSNFGEAKIFVMPHKSIGDVFILGLFLKGGARLFKNNFLLVVIGDVCQNLASCSGFEKVVALSPKEMDCLLSFIGAAGCGFCEKNLGLQVLHFAYRDEESTYKLLNCSGLNFLQCYENLVFEEKLEMKMPISYKPISEAHKKLFDMQKGRSVIISPYSKSLEPLPLEFWQRLVAELLGRGIKNIYTNCSVYENSWEKELPGTQRLSVPLDEICGLLDYAGIFIGSRSGLCDVVAATNCKKIIFYRENVQENNAIHDAKKFYTLAQIPFARNFVEHVVEGNGSVNWDEVLGGIL